ncbi:class I SAM-dependent methyltransferase [Levilactobacillus acidifarinae]|uniref:SAM-dependent methyltransferase n=1 Tax=Levilactobacillus acidifarinae DSM 19394 = JCM 15949 TaxID=1423715 RepID=A0A0R1LJS3_9LACO|nr:class I SAM-dependent methyltransferase [Levilactobacillus acidifarinae]KRK96109.1 SAM-dependent methyltransferase [Levilactobacillus acidifarinae DSM 19394]GEO69618.1 type 11 methyltransferase [Levilactobacillus acidifarinae]
MKRIRENGIDGVLGLIMFYGLGVVCLIMWVVTRFQQGWLIATVIYLVMGSFFLHTTLVGKELIWDRVLRDVSLTKETRALDVGCGHGLVMFKIAQRLPLGGHVTGIDIWRQRDQTHNSQAAVERRLAVSQLTQEAAVQTADMRQLPFAPQTFNLVVSSLAIHNVKPKAGRLQSLQELSRVLRPGGQVVLVDLGFSCQEYKKALQQLGFTDIHVTGNGLNGWWGGPWMPTLTLRATKLK